MDALLTEAEQMSAELGWVGKPVRSDARLLNINRTGYLPVIACVAGDRQGQFFNVNADQMAVSVAGAIQRRQASFLTDVDGVRGEDRRHSPLNLADAADLSIRGVATGGMRAKLEAAAEALQPGCRSSSRPAQPLGIVDKLLAGDAIGTRLVAAAELMPHD